MSSSRTDLACALVALALGCGQPPPPDHPIPPAPTASQDAAVQTDIPPFPSDTPATFAAIADALARAFDDVDRDAARRLLADEILPWDLRALPTHPRPQSLAKVGYDALAAELAQVPRARRLAQLEEIACDRRGDRLVGGAISLAVARWIADHRRPGGDEVAGYLEDAAPYLAMSAAARLAEADRLDAALTAWAKDAADHHAACAARHRVPLIHARSALASARNGAFDVAMGALYVFLVDVGERPRELDPH